MNNMQGVSSSILSKSTSAVSGILLVLTIWTREAKIEFGEIFASKLKLTSDGTKVLWPQPTDDPEDPQNVRSILPLLVFEVSRLHIVEWPQKNRTTYSCHLGRCCTWLWLGNRLVVVTFGLMFTALLFIFARSGIAAIFALAKQYDTTTGVINNLTSKYAVVSIYCEVQQVLILSLSAGVYFFSVR
jgi:hypothetical protein